MKYLMKLAYVTLFITAIVPVSAAPFNENGDGTITDQNTGLVWQQCAKGQIYDPGAGEFCSGTASTVSWVNALSYCESLTYAGRSDWRLPGVNVLRSLVKKGSSSPAIDGDFFPATAGSYWSSSNFLQSVSKAWSVNFDSGAVSSLGRTNAARVRCVTDP